MAKTVYTEVSLEDFDTEDLVEELQSRGSTDMIPYLQLELLEKIWMKRRMGNNDYESELDELIYRSFGYIV
jgi:hypothetical protein